MELLKRGKYGINSEYTLSYMNANLETSFDISNPVTTVLMLDAGLSYQVKSALRLDASFGFTKDITHNTHVIEATVGASIDVCNLGK